MNKESSFLTGWDQFLDQSDTLEWVVRFNKYILANWLWDKSYQIMLLFMIFNL